MVAKLATVVSPGDNPKIATPTHNSAKKTIVPMMVAIRCRNIPSKLLYGQTIPEWVEGE